MRKKITFAACLLWALSAAAGPGLGQEHKAPFTKEEILRLLKPVPGERYEQGDLAAEIAQRGVAFPVDERTLNELRRAGARSFLLEAIQQAARPADQPQLKPNPAGEAQLTKEADRPAAPAEAPAQLPLLEQARSHASAFVEELPNFIVTQSVTRYRQTPERKDWQLEDKLEVELTYRVKEGEHFKLVSLNGKPTQLTYEALGGATSTGEFGSMLGALFAPQSQAAFKEVRRELFRGHQTVVFDFKVKKGNSSSQITDKTSGRTITTAYQGSVWIEADTGRVLRIEQSAEDIQRGFPITLAENAVDYDWVMIAGERYLMPVYAEVILGQDSERYYSRNVIELRNYHMFDTDVKIVPESKPPQ